MQDVLLGKLVHENMGEGAIQKHSARRLDMISGNIASHSRLLNSPEQLEHVKDQYELAAIVESITAEQANERAGKAEEKKKVEEAKVADAQQAFQEDRAKLFDV